MFAVIRAHFTATPVSDVWSDAEMRNWLDPTIPYSVAHYWSQTSFSQIDLSYQLLPILQLADPRNDPNFGMTARQRLVNAVLAGATNEWDPDWSTFAHVVIWFPAAIDLHGGGSYSVKRKDGTGERSIVVAVVNKGARFDTICQEFGHNFGFQHERNQAGGEYGSPYSTMSSSEFPDNAFERPASPQLPAGLAPFDGNPPPTTDVMRIAGPYVTPLQFFVNRTGDFVHADSVEELPATFQDAHINVYLRALDVGVTSWPTRRKVLAVVPPAYGDANGYGIEIRRPREYDQGLNPTPAPGISGVAGAVIHSFDPSTKLITYVGCIPFAGLEGDRDYRIGNLVIRLNNFNDDSDFVGVTVGGTKLGEAAIQFAPAQMSSTVTYTTDWEWVYATPCRMFPENSYAQRSHLKSTKIVLTALSQGYEAPEYVWTINDVAVDPAQISMEVSVNVRSGDPGLGRQFRSESITVKYRIIDNRLEFESDAPYSEFSLSVSATVSETLTAAAASTPARSVSTDVTFQNAEIEWSLSYLEKMVQCWREHIYQWTPEDMFGIPTGNGAVAVKIRQFKQLHDHLLGTNPELAETLTREVLKLGNITRDDLFAHPGP